MKVDYKEIKHQESILKMKGRSTNTNKVGLISEDKLSLEVQSEKKHSGNFKCVSCGFIA